MNLKAISLCLLLTLLSTPCFAATDWCADAATGLCLKFEEASSPFIDETANGNDCACTTCPTFQSTGKYDFAADFPETNNQNVSCGSDASLDYVSGIHSFAVWQAADTLGEGDFGVVAEKGGTNTDGWRVNLGATAKFKWQHSFTGGLPRWATDNSSLSLDGTFEHIAVVYDGDSTSNNPLMYINGVSVNVNEEATPSGSVETGATETFLIGINSGNTREFDGDMDEMIYHLGSLDSTDINEIMDCGIDGTQAGAGCQVGGATFTPKAIIY